VARRGEAGGAEAGEGEVGAGEAGGGESGGETGGEVAGGVTLKYNNISHLKYNNIWWRLNVTLQGKDNEVKYMLKYFILR